MAASPSECKSGQRFLERVVRYSVILVLAPALQSQPARLPSRVEGAATVEIHGHLPPAASNGADRGPADPAMRLPWMTLLFRPAAGQQAKLLELAAAQQNPASANYHRWLTAEEYADEFGLDAPSLARVREWLEGSGFRVEAEAKSRTWISFSGTAAAVQAAFHAPLHYYEAGGTRHFAPAAEPSLPAMLAPLVAGIRGLDDFRARPALAGVSGANYLGPDDLAVIYNIAPLHGAGFDGSGEKIVLVGESDLNLDDLQAYRSRFRLPPQDPQVIAVPGHYLVGQTGGAHQREAALDLEIAGAVAPKATLVYIYAPSIDDAIRYAIDTVAGPVLSSSYILCERGVTGSLQADLLARATEAGVKGMTWVNASGDSGPAGCDAQAQPATVATQGVWVNFFSAPPEVTAVGGTSFQDDKPSYWAGGNSTTLGSALEYIPEAGWNESSAAGGLLASGGGISRLVEQPAWQTFPSGGKRAIPDVALSASGSHDPYVLCNGGNCTGSAFGTGGGTSAAAPAFAGMVALIGQYLNRPGGLGNINPILYRLGGRKAFHDIKSGSNVVSCQTGTPDCTTGSYGFLATPGYDLVTGLGSVDATVLAGAWPATDGSQKGPSDLTIAPPATTRLQPGGSVNLNVTVQCGTTPPGGVVSFTAGAKPLGSAGLVPASGGNQSTAVLTVLSSQLTAGTNNITAWFAGNAACTAACDSTSIALSNPAEGSAVNVFVSPATVYEQGNSWTYTITLKESNGGAATVTGYKVGDTDLSAQIGNFGGNQIGPYGVLTGTFTRSRLSPPAVLTIEIDGQDVKGAFIKQVPVTFLGFAAPAALQLTGMPSAVLKNANSSTCAWSAKLSLKETAGTAVVLSQFLTPFGDLSGQITTYWGSPCTLPSQAGQTCMAANANLTAVVCLNNVDNLVPTLVNYVVGGTDAHGNAVSASITVPYLGPAAAPNTLSVSPGSITASSVPALVKISAANAAQVWTIGFASGAKPAWLKVSPMSGAGTAAVVVSASAAGLDAGTYMETMFVQSLDAAPQFVEIPVTLVVK